MTKSDKHRIESALKGVNPENEVRSICRSIVNDYLDGIKNVDRELKIKLGGLVNCFDFGIRYKVNEICEQYSVEVRHARKNTLMVTIDSFIGQIDKRLGTSFLWIIALLLCLVPIFSVVGAYVIYYLTERKSREIDVASKRYECVISTTAEDLLKNVEYICKIMDTLVTHNQLEGHYEGILRWIHNTYSFNPSEELKKQICDQLAIYDYEFLEYSQGLIDLFEASQGNVSEVITTKAALRNRITGRTVFRGHIVCPQLS